jgi:signal peptidase II
MHRKKFIIVAIITFTINYLLDYFTKLYAVNYIKGKLPVYYFYDTIMINYAENSGAFLSMGSNWPMAVKYIALLVLPMIICFYGIYYCFFKETSLKRMIVIISIIAGGLGNLVDRLFNDFTVVDFLNFGIGSFRTGILNVADMSVTFGLFFLLYIEYINNKKVKQLKEDKS